MSVENMHSKMYNICFVIDEQTSVFDGKDYVTEHVASLFFLGNPLTHPKVVHDLDSLLKLYGNVHCNVVVETWPNGEFLRQWGPVILASCKDNDIIVWMISSHVQYIQNIKCVCKNGSKN